MLSRILKPLVVVSLALPVMPAFADQYYPRQVSMRTFGTDQGNVGDCMSEAEINAIEAAFAGRGLGFVKLSMHYRHAVNWANNTPEEQASVMLSLNAADQELIKNAGPLLPDFMWPEAGEGYDPSLTGFRPHPSDAVAWDPAFPSSSTMNFSETYHSLKPGFSNSIDIKGLKARIAAGDAITLSLHGALLLSNSKKTRWDHVTGLLSSVYTWAGLLEDEVARGKNAQTGVSHAVALVGYDDSLYAGHGYPVPGAFIVRNSWNDSDKLTEALKKPSAAQKALLQTMRLKVFSHNLPGYYAIPYQYIQDLIANGISGVRIFQIDYAAFAHHYITLSSHYQSVRAPYVCDEAYTSRYRASDPTRKQVKVFGNAFQTWMDPSKPDSVRAAASSVAYKMALRELSSRISPAREAPMFRYALLAYNKKLNVNRAADFYAGKFKSYYCPLVADAGAGLWPNAEDFAQAAFQKALEGLSNGEGNLSSWYGFLRTLAEISK